MIPYILLMFVPLLFSGVAYSKSLPRYNGKKYLIIGSSPEITNNSCLIPAFFSILILVLALRDESVGRDLLNYRYFFSQYQFISLQDVITSKSDMLYWLWNWIVGRFTNDYQVFLVLTALITVLPIAKVYSEDRAYGFVKIVLFMNMSTFVMMFSGLRQAIAISVGLLAYEYVKKKKIWKFLFLSLIALGFHHTAFVVFVLYPLYYFKIRKNNLIFVIPTILFVFIFNSPIFSFATSIMNLLFGEKYDVEISQTGAYTMLIVFVCFAIISYILPDENKMDSEVLGLRNILLAAVLLQCFAPIHTLAMRLNYYFIIFIPILIPKLFKNTKADMKDVELMSRWGIILFFSAFYLYTTYVSCQTGVSSLDTYPYIPFWRD